MSAYHTHIHMINSMPPGGNPQAFWKHMVGLVLLEMRDRGWTGGVIVDAAWKDGQLDIEVEAGPGKIDVKALADFIDGKRRKK